MYFNGVYSVLFYGICGNNKCYLSRIQNSGVYVLMTKDKAYEQAIRNKSYFPFRLHYIFEEKTGEWVAAMSTTRRQPNKLARDGHTVYMVG